MAGLLNVTNLTVKYPTRFGEFTAIEGINLSVERGEIHGLVGESGAGKSTIGAAIIGLIPSPGYISQGDIQLQGESLRNLSNAEYHKLRGAKISMIFQDPYSSLNNRRKIEDIIGEPIRFFGLAANKSEQRRIVASVLELVEMPQRAMLKYPHQFSGGQRQRIAVARALVARPEFLICDEPTSALDVSIQAQILNLLKQLQEQFGLSILFISHNLAVVRQMADQVVVLKDGQLVESDLAEAFFSGPGEAYSRRLLEETPSLEMIAS